MKKITVTFQDENSTEFKIDGDKLTHRELLVLARELPVRFHASCLPSEDECNTARITSANCPFDDNAIDVVMPPGITGKQARLVADELYLAAQQMFLAPIVQATAQATVQMFLQAMQEQQANQIAMAQMQQSRNSGFIKGVGQG